MSSILNPGDITKNDKVVVIVGPPGCGKSQLIDRLTNFGTDWAREGLNPTGVVRAVRTRNPTRPESSVVLVDTPGWESTNRSELQIKDWLEESRRNSITLTGVLYLHSITDKHMKDTPFLRLPGIFGKFLEGHNGQIVFVTTMWDRVQRQTAEKREELLKTTYLEQLLKSGANTARFYNKEDNEMWSTIDRLLESDARTQKLSSQHGAKHAMDRHVNTTRLAPKKEAEWTKTPRRFERPSSRRMVSFFARKPKRISARVFS